MKNAVISAILLSFAAISHVASAADISGTWRTIDDKTGSSKALLKINKQPNGTYSGQVVEITPSLGYEAKNICTKCPAPYTNKPILGMEILKNLELVGNNQYQNGKILDPLSGNVYQTKVKLSPSEKTLTIRGYLGNSALGRSQTWVKVN